MATRGAAASCVRRSLGVLDQRLVGDGLSHLQLARIQLNELLRGE